MNISMTDKWILVTGASSGIGKAVALHLLDAYSANIVAVGRNIKKMQDVFSAYGTRCRMISYDLVDLDHIQDIFSQIDVKLDGLVHCAGLSPLAKIEDNTPQIIKDTFAVNLFSFMGLVREFSQTGVSNSNSSIVSISSVATEVAPYRQSVYSSSKSALEQFIRCAAKELLPCRIRVNAVSSSRNALIIGCFGFASAAADGGLSGSIPKSAASFFAAS